MGSGRVGSARTLRQKFWLDVTWRQDLHADVAESVAWKPAPSRMRSTQASGGRPRHSRGDIFRSPRVRRLAVTARRAVWEGASRTRRVFTIVQRGRRAPVRPGGALRCVGNLRPHLGRLAFSNCSGRPSAGRGLAHERGEQPADRSRGCTHEYVHETHRPARFVGVSSVRVRRRRRLLVLTRTFGSKRFFRGRFQL